MSAAGAAGSDPRTVKVQDAKTRLSELLREVEEGADITIARGRTPVARLVPFERPAQEPRRRPLGYLRYELPDSFFDALPPEELDAPGGRVPGAGLRRASPTGFSKPCRSRVPMRWSAARSRGGHRDPFDRMLAAQALRRGIPPISADRVFDGLGSLERIW